MADQGKPDFEYMNRLLGTRPKTAIITHYNPDGDAIGSSLALKGYLAKRGVEAPVICPNDYPDFLGWLPLAPTIIVRTANDKKARQVLAGAELIFCLDFNSYRRVEALESELAQSPAMKVLIDHHLQPDSFPWMLSDTSASSTGELLFDFIGALGDADMIDSDIGTNLFTAIITDTGSFQHDSTSAKAHRVAAELIDRGVDTKAIVARIYQSFSEGRLRFFGHCMLNKMQVRHDLGVGWIIVSKAEMKQFKVTKGDLEGLVNLPLQIKGVTLSALLQERDGEVKLSLRSTGVVDVNKVAREYFHGGGHRNAAGGSLKSTIGEAELTFKELVPSLFQKTKKITA
jgi:phosphoesterase RecJ-like protein